jgi:type IV pilus assembly protein PilB
MENNTGCPQNQAQIWPTAKLPVTMLVFFYILLSRIMGGQDSFIGQLLGNANLFAPEQIAQTIDLLVEHGVKRGASDIHIEPQERVAVVRYRVDGTLHGAHKLPLTSLPAIVHEIKTLAHVHTDTDVPNTGHFSMFVGHETLEIQFSSIPVMSGEKVVLHLSRRLQKAPSLEALGFWGPHLDAITSIISRPHGIVLVSGPKQSGKATTMYSLVQPLNTPLVSIATVEAGISYRLPGASQTDIHPHAGITFHDGLRAVLSQDPNIIVLGSIPDRDTATAAIEAGSHGHFMVAGTYAPTASSAITYVRGLQQETFLLASALRASIAQRLVRTLCVHCRELYELESAQTEQLNQAFGITSAAAQQRVHSLEQHATVLGLGGRQELHTTPTRITHLWRAGLADCAECHHSGYQGVAAIMEVLPTTATVQQGILGGKPTHELHDIALKESMVPLGLDGLIKAIRGITTIEEVLRALPPR